MRGRWGRTFIVTLRSAPLPEMRGHAYIYIYAEEFELAHPINTDTPTTYMLHYYVDSTRYEHLTCV